MIIVWNRHLCSKLYTMQSLPFNNKTMRNALSAYWLACALCSMMGKVCLHVFMSLWVVFDGLSIVFFVVVAVFRYGERQRCTTIDDNYDKAIRCGCAVEANVWWSLCTTMWCGWLSLLTHCSRILLILCTERLLVCIWEMYHFLEIFHLASEETVLFIKCTETHRQGNLMRGKLFFAGALSLYVYLSERICCLWKCEEERQMGIVCSPESSSSLSISSNYGNSSWAPSIADWIFKWVIITHVEWVV